jgi:Spy/CpxP family protein refolding chaperone
MKRILRMTLMAGSVALAVTTPAGAQDAGPQGRPARGQMAAMMKGITLTDTQKAKLDSIAKVFADRNAPLMARARAGDADARTRMQEINKARSDAMKSVLTDEQKKQFDANAAMLQGRGRPPIIR